VDQEGWTGPEAVWDPFVAAHKSYSDLQADRKSQGGSTSHTKIESTVRYLSIEVDDALTIAEQVDV